MKAKDRYIEDRVYTYDDLTEQEKSDAVLTMDPGVRAREALYRFRILTPDEIHDRFDYDLDAAYGGNPLIQKLMMDIAANGVKHAAVDREGNHRMIACAILEMGCPWFEVVPPEKRSI